MLVKMPNSITDLHRHGGWAGSVIASGARSRRASSAGQGFSGFGEGEDAVAEVAGGVDEGLVDNLVRRLRVEPGVDQRPVVGVLHVRPGEPLEGLELLLPHVR